MSKGIEVQAPKPLVFKNDYITLFLGGSIEMGKAEDWQKKLIKSLEDEKIIFFNPRRDDWDSSWEQKITNPEFKKQVTWELKALESSDVIVIYFDPKTKSPISLLELGLHAKSEKLIVLCPDEFYRKGNVDIVCERYGIKQVETFEDLVSEIKSKI
jgi:hypothetical protein